MEPHRTIIPEDCNGMSNTTTPNIKESHRKLKRGLSSFICFCGRRQRNDDENVQVTVLGEHDVAQRFDVKELSKRELAKVELRLCGNEGRTECQEKNKLRRLIQEAISNLEKEKPKVLQNGRLLIHTDDGDIYEVHAGKSKHKLSVMADHQGVVNYFREE